MSEFVNVLLALAVIIGGSLFLVLYLIERRKRKAVVSRYAGIADVEKRVHELEVEEKNLVTDIEVMRSSYREKRAMLHQLEREVAVYDEKLSFAELGVYEPHFDFGDSETYKQKIAEARERQKQMVSDKTAVTCPTQWLVEGSASKGKMMTDRQIRLTLRAFNNECEAAIAYTRWNNVNGMEKRIQNAATQIDKMNASSQVVIAPSFFNLKLRELYLTHEYREALKREREERAEVARLAREEQKLIKEVERAEKEEERYRAMLEKARAEVASAVGNGRELMLSKIQELEADLAAAHSTSERARSMAEMTRSGYVYIISNVGSFGEDVVKIGLTRRLDPEDRVRELGDASVPFLFDTHALIYSDNAPELESALHAEFHGLRINTANLRKEFFRVGLDEVEKAVARLFADGVIFQRPRGAGVS